MKLDRALVGLILAIVGVIAITVLAALDKVVLSSEMLMTLAVGLGAGLFGGKRLPKALISSSETSDAARSDSNGV
ncbi:MAG: hypothetical protein UY48_C0005G0062 [Candidatus Gottesmanbacteria bacterium GW2011_GWB1_49_7]|uniref:Uncharacterized protein n=1 Tax=Candidatus Gottesmanbacteria bacterium GW2011_GWB1_49_7 TaxID=1618448 RepID=A0A0G1W2Z7_9BACT|nr:MAG: hypothetical protein UY48_C0005G0062 [Candidatus Gottesmanbacteria bacterium GW2011_GWB1_49_7]